MNYSISFPLLSGVVFGIIFGTILLISCNKNRRIKTDYDERQRVFRGTGYKYAAYTTWALLCVYMLLDMCIELPMENSFAIMTIIFIGLLVQISYSILTDSYWGSNSNTKKYAILFSVITLINILAAYARFASGDILVNGKITFHGTLNLECAIMFLIIGIEMIIKKCADRDEEE